MDEIKYVSLSRLREKAPIPSLNDDVLVFHDIKMLPQLQEPRRMNCLIIGICSHGTLKYTLNQKEYNIKENDAVILSEGEVIDKVSMSDDCQGFALLISIQFVYEIVKDVQNLSDLFLLAKRHPVFPLEKEEVEVAREYLNMVLKRVEASETRFRRDVVRLLLLTMIYDLGNVFYRVLSDSEEMIHSSKSERFFVHFIQLVEHHFRSERRVSWYAEQMGITPKYLSEIISHVSKRSPNEWIDKYVTTEIRNQLRTTDKKISQIAEEMNFSNQSFMGKYFRENVGMSPTKYRKS